MEKRGVIRRVEEPTDWVSVVASLKELLEGYILKGNIFNSSPMNGECECECEWRMRNGLPSQMQIEVTCRYPSMKKVNFSPLSIHHLGGYQVTQFGIKSAQDRGFPNRMSQHFSDLKGAETDINDITVHAETEAKHDQRLHSVLERCEKINLSLNKHECVFKMQRGYIHLSQPHTRRNETWWRQNLCYYEMPAPSDKKGVGRLLGTLNYLEL